MKDVLINCSHALKIAVIGDIMLDAYVDGTVERLSPEAPNCIVLDESKRSYALGGAGNVALNLARFGVDTRLCGAIGSRDYIDAVRLNALIDQLSLDPMPGALKLYEIPADGRRPTVKTRYRSDGQQLLRVDHEDRYPASCSDDAMAAIEAAIDGVNAVIISDYAKGMISDSVLMYLLGRLGNKQIPYLVDPKRTQLNDYAEGKAVKPLAICPNHKEWTHSIEYRSSKRVDAQHIVVTDGRNGCYVATTDDVVEHWCYRYIRLANEVKVADPSGAGDTFIATLAIALLSGEQLEDACRIANCAAACTVKEYGVVTPNVEEVQEMIHHELKVARESPCSKR